MFVPNHNPNPGRCVGGVRVRVRDVLTHTSPEQYGTKTRFQVCRSGLVAGSGESMPLVRVRVGVRVFWVSVS